MNKKIRYIHKNSEMEVGQFGSACVISSPSAWAQFLDRYANCPTPSRVILSPSIQLKDMKKMASSIKEDLVVGIGGGQVMDASKALAKMAKTACILIPSILSTTAWFNPTSSLKDGAKVYHMRGKYNRILIDCQLIASAPTHLNFGGLMDLLVGYNGLADWRLKKQDKGGAFPKQAETVVLGFCTKLQTFMETNSTLTPEIIPQFARYFIEGTANCYGLLSGRPLDSGEHLLYYAIEERIDKPMNHGAVISLCLLICTHLHGPNAYIKPETLKNLIDNLGIKYRLDDMGILPEQMESILEGMQIFVETRKDPYSIWNTHPDLKNIPLTDLLR